jgi:hypothetical protein
MRLVSDSLGCGLLAAVSHTTLTRAVLTSLGSFLACSILKVVAPDPASDPLGLDCCPACAS